MRTWLLILSVACCVPQQIEKKSLPVTQPSQVMPLGDSITARTDSYRGYLRERLDNAMIADVDFVGGQYCQLPASDPECEGHPGYKILDLDVDAYYAASFTPGLHHVILVHAGTNDVNNGDRPLVAAWRMQYLLERTWNYEHGIQVFLAGVIPLGGQYESRNWMIKEYNQALTSAVDYMEHVGQDITFVNMFDDYPGGFDPDGAHPDAVGAAWMAEQWFDALIGS